MYRFERMRGGVGMWLTFCKCYTWYTHVVVWISAEPTPPFLSIYPASRRFASATVAVALSSLRADWVDGCWQIWASSFNTSVHCTVNRHSSRIFHRVPRHVFINWAISDVLLWLVNYGDGSLIFVKYQT